MATARNQVEPIRPPRRVSKLELFDGGVLVTLTDGVGIRISYGDGRVMLVEEEYQSAHAPFREVELPEVA